MNQATLAWAAFKNMLRVAARDPVWALTCILMSPFRAGRYLLQVGFFILLVTLMLAAAANGIPQEWWIASALTQSEGSGNRLSFARMVSAGFVQTKGFGSEFCLRM